MGQIVHYNFTPLKTERILKACKNNTGFIPVIKKNFSAIVQLKINTPQNTERSSALNFYEKRISKVKIFLSETEIPYIEKQNKKVLKSLKVSGCFSRSANWDNTN